MTLSKAVLMGEVARNPEKRFTNNNLPITSFALNIGTKEDEALLRVIAVGKLAETAQSTLSKGSKVIIEGKLQTNTVRSENGEERKIVELSAQAIETLGETTSATFESDSSSDFLFEDEEISDELIGEDEIPF